MKKLASLFVIAGMLFISCGNKTNQEEEVVVEDTVAVVEDTVVVAEDTVPAEEVAPVVQPAPKKAVKKQQVVKAKTDLSKAKDLGISTKDAGGATVSTKSMQGDAKTDLSNSRELGISTKDAGGATVSTKPMSGNNNSNAAATATPVNGGKEIKF